MLLITKNLSITNSIWRILMLFLLAWMVAGCGQATPDQPTETSTITVTATSTVTLTPTLTPTITPTPTRTVAPTRTPVPTATVFPAVAQTGLENAVLQTPDAGILLNVIDMAARQEEMTYKLDSDDKKYEVLSADAAALYRLLAADVQEYYPTEFPNASDVWSKAWKDNLREPVVRRLVGDGLAASLNQGKFTLEDGKAIALGELSLIPIQAELDGDANPEWLVTLGQLTGPLYPIDLGEDGQYRLAQNDLGMEYVNMTEPFIDAAHDLTGDQAPDLVVHIPTYAWGTYFGTVYVYQWTEAGLYQILAVPWRIRSTDFWDDDDRKEAEVSVGDQNGDGKPELTFKVWHNINYGCIWQEIDTYRWNGDTPAFTSIGAKPPQTGACFAAQALDPRVQHSPTEKLALIEKALGGLSSQGSTADLVALLRLHQAAAYAMQNQDSRAWQTVANLPWSDLSQVVAPTFQQNRDSFIKFCSALVASVELDNPYYGSLGTDIDQYLSYSAVWGAYPIVEAPVPQLLCPLTELSRARLEGLKISATESISLALQTNGFPISQAEQMDIDSDGILEMVFVSDLVEPQVIVAQVQDSEWKVRSVFKFSGPIDQIEFLAEDIDGDLASEFFALALLSSPTPNSAFTACWQPGAGSTNEIVAARTGENGAEVFWGDTICGQAATLKELASSGRLLYGMQNSGRFLKPGQGISDIQRMIFAGSLEDLEQRASTGQDFFSYLEQIESEIVNGTAPADTRSRINQILNSLSPEAPGVDNIRSRLRFLIGYFSEKEGQTRLAVQNYQALIKENPSSPWAWLALARLHK